MSDKGKLWMQTALLEETTDPKARARWETPSGWMCEECSESPADVVNLL